MPAIKNKRILTSLLQKMYWIESEMEQLGIWEARIELMNENIEALETLSHDSDKHWIIIEKWLTKTNIKIPQSRPNGVPEHVFDFDGLAAQDIFSKILKYEVLSMNAYKDVLNTDPTVIEELLPDENDKKDFLRDFKQLIVDEEKHAIICRKQIGGFAKVMY
ncbi:hypothetical protein V7O66_07485 [Methanolobus sp. ZRKC3]|uniref:hypothetical protein n=1 Tax=Methanolobus sp. ZRKC3 TaxID=3125786 RepID=UPI00324F9D57